MYELFDVLNQNMGVDYRITQAHPWKYRIFRNERPVAALTLDDGVVHIIEGTNLVSNRDRPVLSRVAKALSSRSVGTVYAGGFL